jgi:hypothetical protein
MFNIFVKVYFNKLLKNKEAIEKAFENKLFWEELPDNKMSRIKIELQGVSLFNETYWEKMNNFFVFYLPKFESAIKPFIRNLKE